MHRGVYKSNQTVSSTGESFGECVSVMYCCYEMQTSLGPSDQGGHLMISFTLMYA